MFVFRNMTFGTIVFRRGHGSVSPRWIYYMFCFMSDESDLIVLVLYGTSNEVKIQRTYLTFPSTVLDHCIDLRVRNRIEPYPFGLGQKIPPQDRFRDDLMSDITHFTFSIGDSLSAEIDTKRTDVSFVMTSVQQIVDSRVRVLIEFEPLVVFHVVPLNYWFHVFMKRRVWIFAPRYLSVSIHYSLLKSTEKIIIKLDYSCNLRFFHSTTTFFETDDTFVGILHRIIEQVMYDNPASFERIIRWHREILSHSVHQIPFLCDMMTL